MRRFIKITAVVVSILGIAFSYSKCLEEDKLANPIEKIELHYVVFDGDVLTAGITNYTNYTLGYGKEYKLQKLVDHEWVDVPFINENVRFNKTVLYINEGDTEEIIADVANRFGQLDEGSYRVIKKFSMLNQQFKEKDIYIKYFEFIV